MGTVSTMWLASRRVRIFFACALLGAGTHGSAMAQAATASALTAQATPTTTQAPKLFLLEEPWPADEEPGPAAPIDTDNTDFDPHALLGKPWQGQVDAVDDGDGALHWQLIHAPTGMTLAASGETFPDDDGHAHRLARLAWTPGPRAAFENTITVRVVDDHGNAVVRDFKLEVDGGNHAPFIEDLDVGYSSIELDAGKPWTLDVRALTNDADGDELTFQFDHLPPGARYDVVSGVLTWTPTSTQAGTYNDVVLRVSDGTTSTSESFNITVNPAPSASLLPPIAPQVLHVGEAWHAQLASLPAPSLEHVTNASTRIVWTLGDGAPAGMHLDRNSGRLDWTPTSRQIGKHHVKVRVGEYPLNLHQAMDIDLDVVAGNPRTDTVPGNSDTARQVPAIDAGDHVAIVGHELSLPVRVSGNDSGSGSEGIVVHGGDPAHPPTISFPGLPFGAHYDATTHRLHWAPTAQQLGEHVITVQAADGKQIWQRIFRIKVGAKVADVAPMLALTGIPGAPVVVGQSIVVEAKATSFSPIAVSARMLARGRAFGGDNWQVVVPDTDGRFHVRALHPGIIELRASVANVDGYARVATAEIHVASAPSQPAVSPLALPALTDTTTNAVFKLGGHAFALARSLPASAVTDADFGNWLLRGYTTRISPERAPDDPWSIGTTVSLHAPAHFGESTTQPIALRFTLQSTSRPIDAQPGAPLEYSARFVGTPGWTLHANAADHLQLRNEVFYAIDDTPWQPAGYTLDAPDGTRYTLDADGRITDVRFADGVHWLVADSGIALAGNAVLRIQFWRDAQGRIVRVSGPIDNAGKLATINYRYDGHGRLVPPGTAADHGAAPHGHVPPLVIAPSPHTRTHAGLAVRIPLAGLARDPDGNGPTWRLISASHGHATLGSDGESVVFAPDAGFHGEASVTVAASNADGATTLVLPVSVSAAKLTAIHLAPLDTLAAGQTVPVVASVDFADQRGVDVGDDPAYLTLSAGALPAVIPKARAVIAIDDAHDRVHALRMGPAVLVASHTDANGRTLRTIATLNVAPGQIASTASDDDDDDEDDGDDESLPVAVPDVLPVSMALVPGGSRQLDVRITDPGDNRIIRLSPEPSGRHNKPRRILYFSSDTRVATVSADGLVSAQAPGHATISAVYLYNADWSGSSADPSLQTLAQTDVAVTVAAPSVGTTKVSAHSGGVITDTNGDALLIGPGALPADTRVTIRALDATQLAHATGRPLPGPGVLRAVAAFHVDVGKNATTMPLQYAIPAQGTAHHAGARFALLRRGPVMQPQPPPFFANSLKATVATWWLVGTAHLGADGKLHANADHDYAGIRHSGDYLLMRVLPKALHGAAKIVIPESDWIGFDGLHITLGAASPGGSIYDDALAGALLHAASGLTLGGYHFGLAAFKRLAVPVPHAKGEPGVDVGGQLPTWPGPYGHVISPGLLPNATSFDPATGKLGFGVEPQKPPVLGARRVVLRRLLPDETHPDIATISRQQLYSGRFSIDPPHDLAVSTGGWALVLVVPTDAVTADGTIAPGKPIEFRGSETSLMTYDARVATTSDGFDVYRQVQIDVRAVGHVDLRAVMGKSGYAAFRDAHKVQPFHLQGDGSRYFVAGKGKLLVFDTQTAQQLPPVTIPGGHTLTSLTGVSGLLFVGQRGDAASGRAQYPLLMVHMDPQSGHFREVQVVKAVTWADAPCGISGMALDPSGDALVIGVPACGIDGKTEPRPRGRIMVLDLTSMDFSTGDVAPPWVVDLFGSYPGTSPWTIAEIGGDYSGYTANKLHIANSNLPGYGDADLLLTRDARGVITGVRLQPLMKH